MHLTGGGRYTDGAVLPQMIRAYVLRSPVAHARITRIDVQAARRMPGVQLVATGEDLWADGLGDAIVDALHCHNGLRHIDMPAAPRRVRSDERHALTCGCVNFRRVPCLHRQSCRS